LGYLTPEVGVFIQSGGKRLGPWEAASAAIFKVPDIQFEVVFEITHQISARQSEAKSKICLQKIYF
jgi:hypothetical protein